MAMCAERESKMVREGSSEPYKREEIFLSVLVGGFMCETFAIESKLIIPDKSKTNLTYSSI
jgi:hypothetical protein